MKVSDLRLDQIKPGLRIQSLVDKKQWGTIVFEREGCWFVLWDSLKKPQVGFIGNRCYCKVLMGSKGPVYIPELILSFIHE